MFSNFVINLLDLIGFPNDFSLLGFNFSIDKILSFILFICLFRLLIRLIYKSYSIYRKE